MIEKNNLSNTSKTSLGEVKTNHPRETDESKTDIGFLGMTAGYYAKSQPNALSKFTPLLFFALLILGVYGYRYEYMVIPISIFLVIFILVVIFVSIKYPEIGAFMFRQNNNLGDSTNKTQTSTGTDYYVDSEEVPEIPEASKPSDVVKVEAKQVEAKQV